MAGDSDLRYHPWARRWPPNGPCGRDTAECSDADRVEVKDAPSKGRTFERIHSLALEAIPDEAHVLACDRSDARCRG